MRKGNGFDDLRSRVFDSIEDELGFFYEFQRARVAKLHAWSEIEKQLDSVVVRSSTPWPKRLIASFGARKALRELVHALIKFKADELAAEGYLHQHHRNLYATGAYKAILQYYLDKEIENDYKYPTNDFFELLKFEEERTKQVLEWVMLLLAAILGGMIGAFFTHALSQSAT